MIPIEEFIKTVIRTGNVNENLECVAKQLSNRVDLEILVQLLNDYSGEDYSFLLKERHLDRNICLLGFGGSIAYGTNTPTSDIDIRGIAINTCREILTRDDFEQICNSATDTTIYSFNKIIKLLTDCNPNTVEILGLEPEHYLYVDDIGKMLLENRNIFLSKRCINTFGGYAYAQLRRLDNKSARSLDQSEHEVHILHSIENAKNSFPDKYFEYPEDSINLYVDDSERDDLNSEIFMDISLKHYPLRDYKCMWAEMHNIVKEYAKLGHRNKNAIAREKLGKHMMHLIRLYMMCIDILEKQEIVTYREKEHDLLMDIRNNKYLDTNNQPTKEFMDMVAEYQNRMEVAAQKTELPDKPRYKEIKDFQCQVNEFIVLNRSYLPEF